MHAHVCRYKYIVLGRDKNYFVDKTKTPDAIKKFSETDIKCSSF
jgi:hypothetical protein